MISACNQGNSFVSPQYQRPLPETESNPLQVFRAGESEAIERLTGIYSGEVIHLEVEGVGPGGNAAWISSDVSIAVFKRPGELTVRRSGNFEIRVHGGGQRLFIPATALPALAEPEDGENFPSPEPVETPEASPVPTPSPNGDEIPEAIPSDPFMDEVITFNAGNFSGFGSENFPEVVLGGPQGSGTNQGGTDVLSLGIGGSIVLKSETPILDGEGGDFIVFENPFLIGGNPNTPFVELGEVAVSQDGEQFFIFPCEAENDLEQFPGCAGVNPVLANILSNTLDPSDPEVAGGDAFDINELGLSWIQYIRIRALSSSGNGNSAGFDLDAIAIRYQ